MKRFACSTWADASGIENNTTDHTRRSDANILMRGLAPALVQICNAPDKEESETGREKKKKKRYDIEKGRKYARN